MNRRPVTMIISVALALATALLLGAAGPAGGANAARGATLRLGDGPTGIDPADPADFWHDFEGATTLPLVSVLVQSGELRLLPTGARALPDVSADGRTYTFAIRKGLRFSDGRAVSARNYAVAFQRFLAKHPGDRLFEDIVGARAAEDGAASGVQVRNGRLVIRLVAPAGDFLVRLASSPITATPLDLPLSGVRAPLPSAGPYYVKEWVPDESALLVRNPHWRRDLLPWRSANADSVVYEYVALDQQVELVERGELDVTFVLPKHRSELAAKYGVNTGRFRVVRNLRIELFAFNNDSPLFRGNPQLRQAVNFALDRRELLRQVGPFRGMATDQLLMPGNLGYRDWNLYPLQGPNLKRARTLAKGHLRSGKLVLWTWAAGTGGRTYTESHAQAVRFQLAKIGLEVEIDAFEPAPMIVKSSERDARWDMAYFLWACEIEPSSCLRAFDSRNIRYGAGFEMLNASRFRDPSFDRRLRAAARLSGSARFQSYAVLERDLMRDAAPVAPFLAEVDAFLLSRNLGCFTTIPQHPLSYDLGALCTK